MTDILVVVNTDSGTVLPVAGNLYVVRFSTVEDADRFCDYIPDGERGEIAEVVGKILEVTSDGLAPVRMRINHDSGLVEVKAY